MVVSVEEKSKLIRQVGIRKTNYPEPLLTRREALHDIKTKVGSVLWDQSASNLTTVLMVSGV
jgi:hypothetical protein